MPSIEYYRYYAKRAAKIKGKRQGLDRIRAELYLASEYHKHAVSHLRGRNPYDAGAAHNYHYHTGRRDGILRALELLDGTMPVCPSVDLLEKGHLVNNVGLD